MEKNRLKSARLPEDLEAEPEPEPEGPEVKVGESGWLYPGYLIVAADRSLWLYTKHPLGPEQDSLCTMLVHREQDGFIVDLTQVNGHQWEVDNSLEASFYDQDPEHLPVIKVTR